MNNHSRMFSEETLTEKSRCSEETKVEDAGTVSKSNKHTTLQLSIPQLPTTSLVWRIWFMMVYKRLATRPRDGTQSSSAPMSTGNHLTTPTYQPLLLDKTSYKLKSVKSKGMFICQHLSCKGRSGKIEQFALKKISSRLLGEKDLSIPDDDDWMTFAKDCERWSYLAIDGFRKIDCPDISWICLESGEQPYKCVANLEDIQARESIDMDIMERATSPLTEMDNLDIVVELRSTWYRNGNLKTYAKSHLSLDQTGFLAAAVLCRLADALSFIHSRSIVHGLLDTESILVNDFRKPVLPLPFLRGIWDESRRPSHYLAPEQRTGTLQQRMEPQAPVDVYTWGIIAHEVFEIAGKRNPVFGIFHPLINDCMQLNPRSRPTATQVADRAFGLAMLIAAGPDYPIHDVGGIEDRRSAYSVKKNRYDSMRSENLVPDRSDKLWDVSLDVGEDWASAHWSEKENVFLKWLT